MSCWATPTTYPADCASSPGEEPTTSWTPPGFLRVRGTIGLVGAQSRDLVLGPAALATGKTVMGILEGDAVPRRFLPQLIELWQQGRFPIERLVRTYPLSEINTAERDAASGVTVKPVLLPGS